MDILHHNKMDGCSLIDINSLSILDDIIPTPNYNTIENGSDEPLDELLIMEKEKIEYKVTLQGFWEDIDKRIWKSNHKLYKIDENNYATIMDRNETTDNEPPAFVITKRASDQLKKRRKTE